MLIWCRASDHITYLSRICKSDQAEKWYVMIAVKLILHESSKGGVRPYMKIWRSELVDTESEWVHLKSQVRHMWVLQALAAELPDLVAVCNIPAIWVQRPVCTTSTRQIQTAD